MGDYLSKKKRKNSKLMYLHFFLSAFTSLLIMLTGYHFILKHDFMLEQNRYSVIAEDEATHIATTIECVVSRTNTLEALIQASGGNCDFFKKVAENVYNGILSDTDVPIKNIAIAPSGIVSDVYPLKGNERFLGFNFLDTSRPGNVEALKAYEQGGMYLTNPFPLIQGGVGLAGRRPVFIDDANGKFDGNSNGKLWGLVTVTIDFEELMKTLHFNYMNEMGMIYELSYIDNERSRHVMKTNGKIGKNAVHHQFPIRNLTLELTIEPKNGWIYSRQAIVYGLAFIVVSCFIGIFSNMLIRLRESNAQLLKISITDKLTDCFNRRAYETDFLNFQNNEPADDFVYVSIDINGLKPVNDTLGHSVGDELIAGTSECLKKHFDDYGKVYRTGGDEFVAMIFVSKEKLSELSASLSSAIENWHGIGIDKMSVSIGYAEKRDFPDLTVKQLSITAEKRMYAEKNAYYVKNGLDRRCR